MNEKTSAEVVTNSKEVASRELETFVSNPGLVELANLFGVDVLPGTTTEKLSALQEIASQHWDFRKGAERQAVDWNDELLDKEGTEQWNVVFAAADKLGLVQSSKPVNKHPKTLAILGGANKSPLDRLKYGLSVVDDFDQLVYLGSSRAITDAERPKIADYAPNAKTEFDLGCRAFEELLSAKIVDEINIQRDGDTWGMRLYEFDVDGVKKHGFALSTPFEIGEGENKRRANTYDNYRFFADRAELSQDPDHTVVSITNAFYTAGQHLPAVQELTLPYGVKVETVGYDAQYNGVVRKPSQLLQETKAAIDAAVRLDKAISEA
ncbi:MAG: hypothetical protein ABSB12_02275 [Candidatus Saccharimonadales bacterium]|jgi:hypothetical protein